MISVQRALEIIASLTPAPRPQQASLDEAAGSILADDVASDMLLPPFDRATMDGFAFRSQDVGRPATALRVVGEAAAGRRFRGIVGPGEAVQIMTGAPVPEGADCVQMIEKTEPLGDTVIIRDVVEAGKNVAAAGREVGKEDRLPAGRRVGSAELAVLAAFGATRPWVFQPPSIALLMTGSELVEAGVRPGPDQIRNSNAYSLAAQIRSCGAVPTSLGIAPDDKGVLQEKILEALRHEIAVVSGGVSMGKYDLVGQMLKEAGAQVHFDRVAIRPGKPFTFATCGGHLFFGLPGNPVSSFVTFEVFVRPAIASMMKKGRGRFEVQARMKHEFVNRGPRECYAPARTVWDGSQWLAEVIETRGSADIFRFSAADSLLVLPADSSSTPGTERTALLLHDYWERTQLHG